ncbi:MAG: hypothetical protein UU49_C0008G0023 [Candidatus Magasanikbacteria bacterium GW2011_GWC2_41_17]|uniref:Uncharacterized protein n=1 Tax=Candidatus Magasanikbacteria bacterium GW2011_GWC2_41_17 TaxID=1619048 RepID=A0A0G0VEM0_9BACT|nr:MAG: hypothetical protein UU49_C0008G0023 [Candidatus Magasanikbacteria bacterium GW2011_GWC2_41_17]
MKLDKNGYRSENHGSFATAVKVLTFIFGLGVAIAIVCLYALTQGCGSSSNGSPVYETDACGYKCSDECPACGYIENGICMLNNCVNNGDGWVSATDGYIYPPGDTCNFDTCSGKPPLSMITGACEAIKAGKKPPEMCMPYWAQITKCITTDETAPHLALCGSPEDSMNGKDCYCYGKNAYDPETEGAKLCSTKDDCLQIACEEWPPEVCWGLPCMLVGKWSCPASVHDYSNLEFYDNGDGYCRIENLNGYLYYKPGDDHVQWPPFGSFEYKYALLDGGSQLETTADNGTYICTKLADEE